MVKNWKLLPFSTPDLASQLLINRGVTLAEQAAWRAPSYERDIHDPFLMKDMDKAVQLVWHSIAAQEKIVIFADYDADGVPGAVVLAEFFKQIGFTNYQVYIPDRHEEDYGLSLAAIEQLVSAGFKDGAPKLLITVDCGISNVAEVARAKERGLKVIITDHHLPPEKLPAADAILNPKQADDNYPEKMLCGAGVAFKLVRGLIRATAARASAEPENFSSFSPLLRAPHADKNFPVRPALPPNFEKWLLDLVAIATIGDMVPLRGENRALAYFGLKILRRTRRPGLISLYRVLKLMPQFVSEDDIGFSVAPRINSASRMSHASEAYDLLIADEPVAAMALAEHLEEKNKERKHSVDKIMADMAIESALPEPNGVIVAGSETWNLGVLGLAAARLSERYGRPVFLWGRNGRGLVKGSCRSNGLVNVVELMRAAGGEGLFSKFGGHALAGGFSIEFKRVAELVPRLNAAYTKLVEGREPPSEELLLDAELSLDQVSEATSLVIESLGPYGAGYPKPLFYFPRVRVKSHRLFGGDKTHLELELEDHKGYRASAICFFQAAQFEEILRDYQIFDLAAHLEKSYFRGRPELRLRIVDLRPSL